MIGKAMILFVSFVALAGCTSMRAVDMAQADFVDHFEVGDHLVVYEKQGRIIDMQFTEVEDGVLYGSLSNDGLTTVEVRVADIQKIEIEKISGARTTGAIVGGIILLPVVAAGGVLAIAASGT